MTDLNSDLPHSCDQLRRQLELLSSIVDSHPDPLFVKNGDGQYVFCNEAATRFFGRPAEQVIGQTDDVLFGMNSDVAVTSKASFAVESAGESEEHVICERSQRVYHVTKSPWRDRSGVLLGMIGIAREVTKRKRVDEAIRRINFKSSALGREYFRSMLIQLNHVCGMDLAFVGEVDACDGTTIRTLVACHQGRIIDNFSYDIRDLPCRKLFDQTEYQQESNVGADYPNSSIYPLDCVESYSGIALQASSGQVLGLLVLVHRVKLADLELPRILLHGLVSRASAELERVQTEDRLRASEARFRTVVDHATDALFLFRNGGQIIDINREACESLGYTREELLALSPFDFGPELTAESMHDINACLNRQEVVVRDSTHRRKDGSTFPIEIRLRSFSIGEEKMAVALVRNITERKRNERLLLNQKQILERMASGAPFFQVLTSIVELVEDRSPDAICSILLCDDDGCNLRFGVAPGLPNAYNKAVDKVPIAEGSGSCGTAAFRGSTVVVRDIAIDPLWDAFREAALQHGLRSCWSVPIRAGDKSTATSKVLGTFAMYRTVPGEPTAEEIEIVTSAANLAGIAIGRHFAERSIRDSEERFRTLVDQAADAFFLHDENGKFLDVNRQACETLGYTREELLTLSVADIEKSASIPEITASWSRMIPGQNVTIDGIHRRKDGSEFPAEIRLACIDRIEQEGRRYILALARDISTRKESERQLRLNQFSIDHAVDSVFWIAPNAEILYVNDAACRTLGYSREEMVGRTIPEIDGHMTAETWPAHWEDLKQRGSFTFESDHFTKDGRTLKTEVTVNYLHYEGREYNCAVMRDITERKRLEHQLRESQKMEAIGQLAGGIAHDFNNLLTIINGYSEMLLSHQLREKQWNDSIKEISEAGRRAAQLTQQLLAFGRKALNEPKVLDLNAIVEISEKLLRRLIGEQIVLSVRLEPSPVWIKVDSNQLEQVLMNLAVNARDAMMDGGQLRIETVRAEQLSSELIEQTGLNPGRYVRLVVSDSGHGMTDAVLDHIFEPFYTTKPVGKGTGLGLAVVHGIVSQSGGGIVVSSKVGMGTTFLMLFPAVLDEPDNDRAMSGHRIAPRGNETILLVEDEPGVRSLARRILESQGYRVIEARSGSDAILMAEANEMSIHLLLTDVVMPGISGRQLAESLRRKFPLLPVLYISGYTDDGKVRQHVSGQAEAFLQKPFSPQELNRLVRKLIDDASLQRVI